MVTLRRASLLLLLLAGCEEELKPETVIEGLRVLGIRASPADLTPGQTAVLEALVVDPSRRGKKNTVLWIGCDPDPLNLSRSACSDTATLSDPSALASDADGGTPQLPPGMRVIGLGDRAVLTTKPDLFAALPADDPRRRVGTVAQALAFAIAEEVSPAATREELEALFTRVRNKEVRTVLALFRLRISEDPYLNANPVLRPLSVDGEVVPEGATVRLRSGEQHRLEVDSDDGSFEAYEQVTPDGLEPRTERLIGAWYSTSGRFSEPRLTLRAEARQLFDAPGTATEELPADRAGELYVVVRDTRGGAAWTGHDFYVCDPSQPSPTASSVQPTSGPADGTAPLSLGGTNLGSVLDVVLGGKALLRGTYSPARSTFEGVVPRLDAGTYPLTIRTKACDDLPTGLTYTVP